MATKKENAPGRRGALHKAVQLGGERSGNSTKNMPSQVGGHRRLTAKRWSEPLASLGGVADCSGGEVRVTLQNLGGKIAVDLRLFEPFGAAKTMMPTVKAVTLDLDSLDALHALLRAASTRAVDFWGTGGES